MSQEMLATLLSGIEISPSPPEIKIMISAAVTVPFCTKEPGGTADVTIRTSMAFITVAVTPPMVVV